MGPELTYMGPKLTYMGPKLSYMGLITNYMGLILSYMEHKVTYMGLTNLLYPALKWVIFHSFAHLTPLYWLDFQKLSF